MMRVLITGGTGLLGVTLQRSAPTDTQMFSTYLSGRSLSTPLPFPILAVDVTDKELMQAVFEWANPDIVIHTAGISSVDFVEKNREEAMDTNVGGTHVVAELCKTFKSKLIYISSNAVFDGSNPFYSETDQIDPINCYGQLKVEAEYIVRRSDIPWAIVRPILMYGWPYPGGRSNLAVWVLDSLEQGKPINVVDNVFSKPLSVWSCAEVIWKIVCQQRTGIYHAAGKDHLSLYRFALQVAEVFDLDKKLIMRVPDSYFPEIAPRPRDTSFDTSKIENELGIKTIGVVEGLLRMKTERTT